MSLLKDIINEATAKTADIPRMLRLCLTLGFKLKHQPLLDWARFELNGYPLDVPLPSYRITRGRHHGYFITRQVKGPLEISTTLLPEKLRNLYETVELRGSISEYINLVKKSYEKGEVLQIPWPVELAVKYCSRFVTEGQCISAWTEISESELSAMVDKIITMILNFALEIEAEAPDAGEIESINQTVMKEERVTQIFNTTIKGNVQNYSAGGTHFQQTAMSSVQQGDLESLLSFLRTLGLGDNDLSQLEAAIKKDQESPPSSGAWSAIKGWLGDILTKAGQGVAGIGADVVSGVVIQAIQKFLGTAI